jgi:hypothetical protein
MSALGRNILFTVLAVTALVAYVYAFELRYMWFRGYKDVALVRQVEIGTVVAVVALWLFFPSRVLVGVIGLFGLLFPPIYDRANFAEVDLIFAGLASLHVGFLIAATQARLWASRTVSSSNGGAEGS